MRLKTLLISGCLTAGVMLFTIPAIASAAHGCEVGAANKGDTNALFQDIKTDASEALYHADQLQRFAQNHLSWDTQALQLEAIKDDVNGIENNLCRLETLRTSDTPRQQAEIDQIAATARLMVDNTQDAILFANDHQRNLWLGQYLKYTDNLFNQASTLAHSADTAVNDANVSKHNGM